MKRFGKTTHLLIETALSHLRFVSDERFDGENPDTLLRGDLNMGKGNLQPGTWSQLTPVQLFSRLTDMRCMGFRCNATVGLLGATMALAGALLSGCAPAPRAVTTYHYDNGRTGWNQNEARLTYATVADTTKFQSRHTVALDDQVDTQPLLVPDETISGGSSRGKHHVLYVATERNTIYAIDAASGAVLLNPNFGPPVPTPQGCGNNGPNVGIDGTPVIDLERNTMYVIIYTLETGGPVYRIHELDLSTLTDNVPARDVTASSNGLDFQPAWQRQRAGLLLADGKRRTGQIETAA